MSAHFPAKCTFCNAPLTVTIKDGVKSLDKACECAASKEYFSAAKVAERQEYERKELVRLGYIKEDAS